jgi:voltage-gated sodium channel
MVKLCARIANDSRFQNFITFVILSAGVLVGIETFPGMVERHGDTLHLLDKLVLGIFVAEIAIKMVAHSPRPWRFFRDPWNVFDFVIVAAALMPFTGEYATVLRLLRLLRVLRLVRALPKLQLLVGALLKSIPSMAYVSVLLGMLFYIYAVAGVFLWSENDPIHFENLQTSVLSLFRVATLEDWTDIMYINMYGCDQYGYGDMLERCTTPSAAPIVSAAYFVSFVLFGTMVILNLFIGVILNGMNEAQLETEALEASERAKAGEAQDLEQELGKLADGLRSMQDQITRLKGIARAGQGRG